VRSTAINEEMKLAATHAVIAIPNSKMYLPSQKFSDPED